MSVSKSKSISIYLTLDRLLINSYFNKHDPSPIYKRQPSHQFEEYIMSSVRSVKRYSVVFYKLKYTDDADRQYAEPLMYALRKYFLTKKEERVKAFTKFKRRNWMVLAISVVIVILCQGFLPMILNQEHRIHSGLSNSIDVFSWVILWHPIDELIFQWNPHLKEISLLHKLATAESIIIENEKKFVVDDAYELVR